MMHRGEIARCKLSWRDLFSALLNDDHIYINNIILSGRFPDLVASGQEGEMSHVC